VRNSKKIFISHSSNDNNFARLIAETLKIYGREVWYDEYDLGLDQFRPVIEKALATSNLFLLLLSEHALQSYWVNLEINAALMLEEKRLMTVVLAPISTCAIPLLLSGHKLCDFTRGDPVNLLKDLLNKFDSLPTLTSPTYDHARSQDRSANPNESASYSIRDIKGKNVIINQGNQTFNYFQSSYSINSEHSHSYVGYSQKVIDSIKETLDSGKLMLVKDIESFIKMMYYINEQGISISTEQIAEIRWVCRQLNILSFF